jgi:hypothetical protein
MDKYIWGGGGGFEGREKTHRFANTLGSNMNLHYSAMGRKKIFFTVKREGNHLSISIIICNQY